MWFIIKKQPSLAANENSEKKFKTFFEKETRRKPDNETLEAAKVEEVFKDIFYKYKSDLYFPDNIEEEPFYNLIKDLQNQDSSKQQNTNDINALEKDIENNINESNQINDNNNIEQQRQSNCDTAFIGYVKEFYSQTNYDYLHFLLKFVVMFRQCINKLKRTDTSDSQDKIFVDPKNYYTQSNNAEGVPDMCNDFVTEFMEPKDYFGMDTMELIEIIQHFCHWLFIKNFTTSRLTLV